MEINLPHISEAIKKAGLQLYSLVQLKRASVISRKELSFLFNMYMLDSRFRCTIIHFALPAYLSQELLESVQIRAQQIICPSIDYHCALTIMAFHPSQNTTMPFVSLLWKIYTKTVATTY